MSLNSNSITHWYIKQLKTKYPEAHCELNYSTPFELLIATILSAQCTDQRVNLVTKVLFEKYQNPFQLAEANQSDVEEIIKPTGFFKNKSKNIILSSKTLVQKFAGEVPRSMNDLLLLSGVGRKTGNVVLGNAFGIISGITVDTHVKRLSFRMGFSKENIPEKIEKDLQKIILKKDWILISHLLIWHGRRHCKARNPQCENCFLFDRCPKFGV